MAKTKNTLLCDAKESQLVVVDLQERLMGAMQAADREMVVQNTGILITAANLLDIPVLATEQYPNGLGHTEQAVAAKFSSHTHPFEKTCFSCMDCADFAGALTGSTRSQYVIAGVEAHVCVLQTAMDLLAHGKDVYIMEDAVCSRRSENKENGLNRIRQAGGTVTNTESVLFEWLGDARHPHFKTISALIR
jgi:nicotinamidase-related amidase